MDYNFQVIADGKPIALPEAQVIGISATSRNESEHGESMVRFLLSGNAAMGAESFDSLSEWYAGDVAVTLGVEEFKCSPVA